MTRKDFDRKLPAIFTGHGAFDALGDGLDSRAIVFELLSAIGNVDAGVLADVVVIGTFVRVLETSPATDVVD